MASHFNICDKYIASDTNISHVMFVYLLFNEADHVA